jgi:hypothetical protein
VWVVTALYSLIMGPICAFLFNTGKVYIGLVESITDPESMRGSIARTNACWTLLYCLYDHLAKVGLRMKEQGLDGRHRNDAAPKEGI